MTNRIIAPYAETLLDSTCPDLMTATLRYVAVDAADYTFNATHNALDDIPVIARVAISDALTGKAKTNGALTAANSKFVNVSGDQFEYLFLFVDTGTESTSVLLAFWDGSTGLPFTPNGADIIINNSSGIFSF